MLAEVNFSLSRRRTFFLVAFTVVLSFLLISTVSTHELEIGAGFSFTNAMAISMFPNQFFDFVTKLSALVTTIFYFARSITF